MLNFESRASIASVSSASAASVLSASIASASSASIVSVSSAVARSSRTAAEPLPTGFDGYVGDKCEPRSANHGLTMVDAQAAIQDLCQGDWIGPRCRNLRLGCLQTQTIYSDRSPILSRLYQSTPSDCKLVSQLRCRFQQTMSPEHALLVDIHDLLEARNVFGGSTSCLTSVSTNCPFTLPRVNHKSNSTFRLQRGSYCLAPR